MQELEHSILGQKGIICKTLVGRSIHKNALKKAKEALSTASILAYFDLGKETRLYTDVSTFGIGFVLLQRATDSDVEWKIVQAGSRLFTGTETIYAVIELECLVVLGLSKSAKNFLALTTLL